MKPDHDASVTARRNRGRILVALPLIVGLGLLTRAIPEDLPHFVVQHCGDALWAVMIYLLFAFARPQLPANTLVVLATSFCVLIECSQLYQADWIRELRHNRLAALVLGHGFLWTDLVAYAAGTMLARLADPLLQDR